MYCVPCDRNHRVSPSDVAYAFQMGEAQIVTGRGIKQICLKVAVAAVNK